MQKILKAPTLIGIRRAVLEYSFLKFHKFGQKEKRQSSKSNLTVLHVLTLFQVFCLMKFLL